MQSFLRLLRHCLCFGQSLQRSVLLFLRRFFLRCCRWTSCPKNGHKFRNGQRIRLFGGHGYVWRFARNYHVYFVDKIFWLRRRCCKYSSWSNRSTELQGTSSIFNTRFCLLSFGKIQFRYTPI